MDSFILGRCRLLNFIDKFDLLGSWGCRWPLILMRCLLNPADSQLVFLVIASFWGKNLRTSMYVSRSLALVFIVHRSHSFIWQPLSYWWKRILLVLILLTISNISASTCVISTIRAPSLADIHLRWTTSVNGWRTSLWVLGFGQLLRDQS